MAALLGLLAVAGYQNREKLAEMFGRLGQGTGTTPGEDKPGGGLPAGNPGTLLSGGLGELLDRLKQSGQGQAAESWVRRGPNQPISADQLETAIGPELLEALSQQTGLSRQELLARLSRDLPDAVDKFTPEGRLPNEDEAARFI
jgi:uncharacterized protein YidB (DUF937 family)